MKTLTIFYDARCGLCCRFRQWLMTRPARVSWNFLPYYSKEAERIFPGIQGMHADQEIIVLADDGRWWQGPAAWITCLWATRDYRGWAYRLAAPTLRPWVAKFVHLLSENRLKMSTLLRLRNDDDLAAEVAATKSSECGDGSCDSGVFMRALQASGSRVEARPTPPDFFS